MDCLDRTRPDNTVHLNNQQVAYHQRGTGQLLVFLPPPLLDHRIYCELQQDLNHSYQTVGVDLPRADNLNQALKHLMSVIHTGTRRPFHLMASSATGWLAQYLAHRLDGQLQSLILINSYHSNASYGTTYRLALKSTKLLPGFKFKREVFKRTEFLRQGIPNNDKMEHYFKSEIDRLGKSGVRSQASWFLEDRADPEPLDVPVLSIFADHDPIITSQQHQDLLAYHPNSEGIGIKTNSHLLVLSHKDRIAGAIDRFVGSITQ